MDSISLLGFYISTSTYMNENGILTNWARLLFFVKIFTLSLIFKRLESAFIIRESLKYWIKLSKLCLLIMVTSHFCACLFFGLGKAEFYYLGIEETWLL